MGKRGAKSAAAVAPTGKVARHVDRRHAPEPSLAAGPTAEEPPEVAARTAVEEALAAVASSYAGDVFAEKRCAPLRELLEEAGLPATCRGMLEVMTPHCLRTPRVRRHQYQDTMIEVIAKVFAGVEAKRVSVVEAAEHRLSDVDIENSAASAAYDAAEEEVSVRSQAFEAAKSSRKSAEDGVESAREAMLQAKHQFGHLSGELADVNAQKEQLDQIVSDQWEALKTGALPGKSWRERNKMIDALLEVLAGLDTEDSLRSTLAVALKTKPLERGKFATRSVEFTDRALSRRVAACQAKLDGFDAETARRQEALIAEKAALQTAAKALEMRRCKASEAEKAMLAAMAARKETATTVKACSQRAKVAFAELDYERRRTLEMRELVAQFEVLRELGSAPPLASRTETSGPKVEADATEAAAVAMVTG